MAKHNYIVRRHVRYGADVPMRFRLVGQFEWQHAGLINLSQGGVSFLSALELSKGQYIEIEFDTVDRLGRNHKRRLLGRVCWRRGTRYGLEFVNSDRRSKL